MRMLISLLRSQQKTVQVFVVAAVLLCAGCRCVMPVSHCPFDLTQVLADCRLSDTFPLQPVAWRRIVDDRPLTVEEVVLLGLHGKEYVLVRAYRHPEESDPGNWSIWATSTLYSSRDVWIVGKREFATYPTEREVSDFLRLVQRESCGPGFRIEYEGRRKLSGPLKKLGV